MPKSRTRKQPKPRSGIAPPHATPATIRAWVLAKATRSGHEFVRSQYHPLGPPVECWTNAWFYATQHNLGYAEGVVTMPNGPHLHAWAVAEDGTAIEVTRGYDVATDYRGWALKVTAVAHLSQAWTGPRSSVLETGYGSRAAPWSAVLARLAEPLDTQPGPAAPAPPPATGEQPQR